MTSFKCTNSFTYALRVIIWDVTDRRGESVRESERRYQRPLADITSKEQLEEEEEIKQEYLAVARLLLPTSNLLLPSTVYILLGVS